MTEDAQDGPMPVRVALSNDYEIALLGLARMLAQHPRQVQIVDLTTLPRVPHEADVILFDTFGRLPQNDVKLRRMVSENTAKVVVYSWEDYPEEAARSAGAAGYLHKGLSSAALVAAIVAIHDGAQPETATTAANDDDDGSDGGAALTWPGQTLGLSQREAEMLSFLARGLTNDEIADRSYLSINTVKTYVASAYRKIGVTSRSQAVAWCYRHGFVSTDDTGV